MQVYGKDDITAEEAYDLWLTQSFCHNRVRVDITSPESATYVLRRIVSECLNISPEEFKNKYTNAFAITNKIRPFASTIIDSGETLTSEDKRDLLCSVLWPDRYSYDAETSMLNHLLNGENVAVKALARKSPAVKRRLVCQQLDWVLEHNLGLETLEDKFEYLGQLGAGTVDKDGTDLRNLVFGLDTECKYVPCLLDMYYFHIGWNDRFLAVTMFAAYRYARRHVNDAYQLLLHTRYDNMAKAASLERKDH